MLSVHDTFEFTYEVPQDRTVPDLLPESPDFQVIPAVFATGYLVALIEWTCIQHLAPHLSEGQGSVGAHIDVSHVAPTLPGMRVTVEVTCTSVDETSASWSVLARDDAGTISTGEHHRGILDRARFVLGIERRCLPHTAHQDWQRDPR